jgi:hypothetical protein
MDFIFPHQFSPSRDESPLGSQILACLLHQTEQASTVSAFDAENSSKSQTVKRAPLRVSRRRLIVEFMVVLCMIGLKVADQQTGCVGTTWAVLVQTGKSALPSEPAYSGLWDGFGGPSLAISRGAAQALPAAMPANATVLPDTQRPGKGLHLGSAHCELAKSRVWLWANRDGHRE